MAAYSAGCSTFGRILPKASDLDGSGICAREGPRRTGDGHNDGVRCRHSAEVDNARANAELDAGHATAGAALRSYSTSREMQQLSIVAQEDQFCGCSGELDCSDHPITSVEADHLPGVFSENLRIHPFHHAARRAECQAQGIVRKRGQTKDSLSRVQSDQFTDVGAALQVRRVCRGWHGWKIQCADLDQTAGAGNQPAAATCCADDLGHDDVVVGSRTHRWQLLCRIGPSQQPSG